MDYRSLSSKTPFITMLWQFDTERLHLTFLHSDQIQRSRPFYLIIWLIIPRNKIVIYAHVSTELEIALIYRLHLGIRLKMKTHHETIILIQAPPCCSQCYVSPSPNEGSRSIYSTPPPFHQLDTYVFTRQNDNILKLLWILTTCMLVSRHRNVENE
jgi:hypothetical protein